MEELIETLEKFVEFAGTYWRLVFSTEEAKDEIIRLVTIEQLFEQGIDGSGQLVQPEGYAPFTIEYKKASGQRFDHVTLNDSGAFYDSFQVDVGDDYFIINAQDNKGEVRLFDVYGEDVAGLTEESQTALVSLVFEIIKERLNEIYQ